MVILDKNVSQGCDTFEGMIEVTMKVNANLSILAYRLRL